MQKFRFKGQDVTLSAEQYRSDGTLAVCINYPSGDSDVITTNLRSLMQTQDMAFLDTNNYPGIEIFIEQNELGIPTSFKERSGFCEYPLFMIFTDRF